MQKLLKNFVCCADEVWRLQNRDDPECLFFRRFSERGHYGGRDGTRQGVYASTPAGDFLASVNSTQPDQIAQMLREALDRWKDVPKKDRVPPDDPAAQSDRVQRPEAQFPEDGLALRVYARDMPRTDLPKDWRAAAWNTDTAWFRKDEMESILPRNLAKGVRLDWPAPLARRLARLSFVDDVRGQTDFYRENEIVETSVRTEVVKTGKGVVEIAFTGRSRCCTGGAWPADPANPPADSKGVGVSILGKAEFDVKKNRFVKFELVAVGTRWGMTRYNFREDDRKPGQIGFVATLTEDEPSGRVAPAFVWEYGWR